MIECRGMGKTYGVPPSMHRALIEIDMTIETGEMVALVGRSGSGKSTMVNLIGLLDRPSEGALYLAGEPTAHWSDQALAYHRNRLLGFIFQSYHLLPRLSVFENVALPLWYRKETEDAMAHRVGEVLADLDMAEYADAFPNTLSGGQQQRVAIARAMVGQPQILLADEPTGALDSANGQNILARLRDMNQKQNTTVLIITHDMEVAKSCDRVLTLLDGRLE